MVSCSGASAFEPVPQTPSSTEKAGPTKRIAGCLKLLKNVISHNISADLIHPHFLRKTCSERIPMGRNKVWPF